jgi:hypothetical protein
MIYTIFSLEYCILQILPYLEMGLNAGKSNSHGLSIQIKLDRSPPTVKMNANDGTLAPLAACVNASLTSTMVEISLVGKPDRIKKK